MSKATTIIRTGMLIALLGFGSTTHAAKCKGEDTSKSAQVEQKLALLERLLGDSGPLRRAESSGNPEALAGIAAARNVLHDAREALDHDCVADASRLSSEGLRIATAAFKVAPAADRGQRDAFEVEHQQAATFMLSLESQPRDHWLISDEDLAGIERQIEHAESLAADGAFGEAVELLRPVNDRLQRRLFEILNNKTLYYEKNFASPADEYAYLKEQYSGYQMLLQSGQKKVSHSAERRINTLLANAAAQFAAAEQWAAAGQWQEAIGAMDEALISSEQAIRASGYSY